MITDDHDIIIHNGKWDLVGNQAAIWRVEICAMVPFPDSKDHGANMGPTWDLSAPGGPHVGPINLAIRVSSVMSQSRVEEYSEPPHSNNTWTAALLLGIGTLSSGNWPEGSHGLC